MYQKILFVICLGLSVNLNAQVDTVKTYTLRMLEVFENQNKITSNRTTSPQQILTRNSFEKTGAFQVSDAVKFFSGVQVKDYGGIGGLKTISLRNMGANYTTISYDGIPITNYLTGQIDLGRFSLDNVEMLQLNIGESDNIFQSARSQALGGSLNIITRSESRKSKELKAGVKVGSFGMFNPSVGVDLPLNNTFSANFSSEYLTSKGNYPYKQTQGFVNSTEEKKKRINSDVENWKLEANLNGKFNNGGNLLFKVFYFDSDRGIPGPFRYYNDENSGERTKDKNAFSQLSYSQTLNNKWKFQSNAKYDFSKTDYQNLEWRQKNKYEQDEFYANAVFLYQPTEKLSFSLANDGSYATFNSNDVNDVARTSWLSALSAKYQTSRITLTGSLLNHYSDNSKRTENHLSPYLGISFRPFDERTFRVRAFYKNTYRLPTFGDLYYSDVPRNLKAENARQYNVGITTTRSQGILFPYFSFSLDAYYNKVENKIVIEPRQSQFKPSVRNAGEVDIKGIDFNLEFHINVSRSVTGEIRTGYTYQHVREKKDGRSLILAYTPEHSGSTSFSLIMPWFDFNYNLVSGGKRYYTQEKEFESKLNSYSDHNISLTKRMEYKGCKLQLSAECLNLYNQQYEIIRSYPMPGRSFRLGVRVFY